MTYDRPYMQNEFSKGGIRHLMWIIGICLGIFVLERFFAVSFGDVSKIKLFTGDWFNLSGENLREGKLWTFLTYGFFHGNSMHIVFNLLIIFIIGRFLEQSIGSKNVLLVFLVSVITGGAIWTGLHFNTRPTLLGASAGAAGMLILFCMLNPEEKIDLLVFFLIPVTIKRKWIAYIALGFDSVLFTLRELPTILNHVSSNGHSIAHSAHLGGMLGGFLFYKWLQKPSVEDTSTEKWKNIEIEPPKWTQKQKQTAVVGKKASFKLNMTSQADMKAEIDRILDKINSDGFGALSDDEKKTLDQAGDQLKK